MTDERVTPHRIRVGPAGWSYKDWAGQVYPKSRPHGFNFLAYLAQYLDAVEFFEERNIRARVLTPEEFARILEIPPGHLKPVLQCTYHTGMREGEC